MADICLGCGESFAISDLCRDKSRKSGYRKLCRPCNRIRMAISRDRCGEVTGVPTEIREGFMDVEMPIWEKRLAIIEQHRLDIDDESHTAKIDKVLALHGLE